MLVPYCCLRKQEINIVSHLPCLPINSSNNMNTVVWEIYAYNNFHVLIFQEIIFEHRLFVRKIFNTKILKGARAC